jgi:hypothetical protein
MIHFGIAGNLASAQWVSHISHKAHAVTSHKNSAPIIDQFAAKNDPNRFFF